MIYITGEVSLSQEDHILLDAIVWLVERRLRPATDDYVDIRPDEGLVENALGLRKYSSVEEATACTDFRDNKIEFCARLTDWLDEEDRLHEGVSVEVRGELSDIADSKFGKLEELFKKDREAIRKARNFIGKRYIIEGDSSKNFKLRRVENLGKEWKGGNSNGRRERADYRADEKNRAESPLAGGVG